MESPINLYVVWMLHMYSCKEFILGFVIANAEFIMLDVVHIYVHVVSYGPNGAVAISLIIKDLLYLFLISIYM